jgi:glutathione S-transferase
MSDAQIFYYAPTACSLAVHIALEEAGVEFEPRGLDLAEGEQTSPGFLAVNPQGRVPAMVVDGRTVTEVPALLAYVASLAPDRHLVPPAGSLAFARCFEWLGFLSSNLHIAYAQFRRPTRFLPASSGCLAELSEEGKRNTIGFFQEVERRLGDDWAAGGAYSIADMNLVPYYTWAWRLDLDMAAECPRWTALFRKVTARAAARRAIDREALQI